MKGCAPNTRGLPFSPKTAKERGFASRNLKHDASLSRSTFDNYSHKVKAYITPHLGNLRLSKLRALDVYEMLDMLGKENKGGRTLQVVHGVLHRACQIARKRGLIATNPVADVEKPRHKSKERVYLRSLDEIKAFVQSASASPLKALFVLMLDTGCRLGELLALQWKDVEEKNALIHIRATLTRDKSGKMVPTRPKTPTSLRTIKLPASSVEALREHHKASLAIPWVFHDKDGQPLRRDGLVRCEFERIGKAIGKPALSSHSLRHSSVTLLMAKGVDLRTIQTRIGHSTPRLTLALYSHTMVNAQDAAVTVLDEVHRTIHQMEVSISGQISGQTEKITLVEKNEIPQLLAG